jgi:AcrR family transcriptional regulator
MGPQTQTTQAPQTRRARLRAETTAEIKRVALDLLADSGPTAISLRAIAREMGMTPNAIYSYFPTRDDLVTALIDDLYSAWVDALEAADDAQAPDDPAARLLAWAETYRSWALANPSGFRLIGGDPIPGYRVPIGGAAPDAERRFCLRLNGIVAAAWPQAAARQSDDTDGWSDLDDDLVATVRPRYPDLPPSAVALALRIWARMHGLVSLEIYGHLGTKTHEPGKLYRAEMRDLARSLGLTPPTDRPRPA